MSYAYNAYNQNNISVESPQKLVEMLYEGVLRFNAQAKFAIKNDDIEKRSYWINRSTAIIAELLSTLDMSQGDIAEYLHGLYAHQLRMLTQANIDNSSEQIDRVSNVFKGLLEAWREDTANVE